MSRTKQMGYYRYRHWSKLRSSSRSCESCVQNIRRQCSAGRKEFCLKRCLLRKSVHMAEDEPLGTDSRQWAGIIWLMHLLPPPLPLHKRISSSLALYLSLRRSKRAGICRVLHSRRPVCATAGPRGFGKTGISSSDVPPLWGCDPHHAKVFRMEAGGRGSVHNVTHASSGV